MTNETIVIDTPDGIYMYRLLSIAHSLAFEIKTGMKMSRISALKVARADGITKSNRKPAALRDVVAHIQSLNPDYVPEGQIKEALSK
jgi:uncharacterized protein with FMN-binding domain